MQTYLRAIAICLLTLAAWSAPAATAGAQDLAPMTSAIPPFTLSYTARAVPGQPAELRLLAIRVSGVNPGSEEWVGGCDGCDGASRLSQWRFVAHEGWVSTIIGRAILTRRSVLIEAVTSPGRVGRFKVYAVKPPGVLLSIKTQGCISPAQQVVDGDFSAHLGAINRSPCSGLLLPSRGTVFHPSDPITVTFRAPGPLRDGASWVLGVESDSRQKGCVTFDDAFFPGATPPGRLLTVTLRPDDDLSIPSPLPRWCPGPFGLAAFSSSDHGRSVRTIAARLDDLSVSS